MNGLTHIAGTFVIHADASFLNGAGLGGGEDRNVTIPKTLQDGKFKVPYVSSQSWKRWLRTTLIEETGWKPSELRSIKDSEKGTTSKISGELDPVGFAEDDLFGYMRAQEGQGKKSKQDRQTVEEQDVEEETLAERTKANTKSVMRASPFAASLLVSIRKKGWQGRDEGFVHLKEGTPLPYTTEFYTTHLQESSALHTPVWVSSAMKGTGSNWMSFSLRSIWGPAKSLKAGTTIRSRMPERVAGSEPASCSKHWRCCEAGPNRLRLGPMWRPSH